MKVYSRWPVQSRSKCCIVVYVCFRDGAYTSVTWWATDTTRPPTATRWTRCVATVASRVRPKSWRTSSVDTTFARTSTTCHTARRQKSGPTGWESSTELTFRWDKREPVKSHLCSKCPPCARMQARRRGHHSLTASLKEHLVEMFSLLIKCNFSGSSSRSSCGIHAPAAYPKAQIL